MSEPLLQQRRLKARADYFFRSRNRARGEVASFASRMAELGPVVVIGGMLRDLYLGGNRNFVSDVDLVVDPTSLSEFDRVLAQFEARKNRFGGYALKLARWRIDIWPLERTWAAVHGYVDVRDATDLLKVTFFDWDAITYQCDKKSINCEEHYFTKVDSRILDINLEPNPNPLGNAVRALRYAWRWNAKLAPRLARHVYVQFCERGWDSLVDAERSSFISQILRHVDGSEVFSSLRSLEREGWSRPVRLQLASEQISFSPIFDPKGSQDK
jgi:hypothetical protein